MKSRKNLTIHGRRQFQNVALPTRVVICPSCKSEVTVAERAMNARCPSCGDGLHLQDTIIVGRSVGLLRTLGNVHVTRRGTVRGNVDCEHLLVEGKLAGDITVKETAAIGKRAKVRANITASRVSIEKGATFSGELRIGINKESAVHEPRPEHTCNSPAKPASEDKSESVELPSPSVTSDLNEMKFASRPWVIQIEPQYREATV